MTAPVLITKASELSNSTGQTEGMTRKGAIVDKASISASIMIAKPHTASGIHHHGAQDTIIYSLRGKGTLVSEGGRKRQDLNPGDFALVPAYAEHQEVNEGDEEVEWIITRSGRLPQVANIQGWDQSGRS